MFRERIIEEKKKLNISVRFMAERSKMHLPEETISRMLTGKTENPGVLTVLDAGDTVGLEPWELFMDETLAAEFKAFLELKNRSAQSEADVIRLTAENANLKNINIGLADKIMVLEAEIKSQDKLIEVYQKCMELLERFQIDSK